MLKEIVAKIQPLDEAAMAAAKARQDILTKPAGSLGRLEELSIQIAGVTGQAIPAINDKVIITMAGDHGVVAEGVSAFPQEVTPQMVLNFLYGGAAINVLSKQVGARISVVDMGVAADMEPHPLLVIKKIAKGTANMTQGPAMSREDAEKAILAGVEIVEAEIEKGLDIIGTGDMGIGNTTPSAAIAAALTGIAPANSRVVAQAWMMKVSNEKLMPSNVRSKPTNPTPTMGWIFSPKSAGLRLLVSLGLSSAQPPTANPSW